MSFFYECFYYYFVFQKVTFTSRFQHSPEGKIGLKLKITLWKEESCNIGSASVKCKCIFLSLVCLFESWCQPIIHCHRSVCLFLKSTHVFSFYVQIHTKDTEGRNWDKWIYFQFFIMPLLFLPAWTADNLLWTTEVETHSTLLKSKW